MSLGTVDPGREAAFHAFMLHEAAAHPRDDVAAEIGQFAEATFGEDD